MSKKLKIILLALSITTITSISINAASNSETMKKYTRMNSEEITKNLKELSIDDLIAEIDSATQETTLLNDTDAIIPFASALLEKKNQLSTSEVIKKIKSPKFKSETKSILIDIYCSKPEFTDEISQKQLKSLLKENIDNQTKQKIINIAKLNSEDIPTLKEIINNGGLSAFYSLNALSKVDLSQAYNVSKDIISTYKNKSSDEIAGAVSVSAKYFRSENKKNTINTNSESIFYDEILRIFDETTDTELKDAIIFSMSDIRSNNSIKTLLNNKNIDREVKVFAIDQNYMVLENILNSNPTTEDIYMVIDAMNKLPIKDLKDEFENLLNEVSDEELIKEINNVITLIEKEGIDANKKWLDF